MTRGSFLSSTFLTPLRSPEGVGGGATTVPDSPVVAAAGGEGSAGATTAAPAPADGGGTSAPVAAAESAAPVAPAASAEPAAPAAAAPAQPAASPSLLEAAKGKEPAAETKETPAKAGTETVAAEPAKEPAKDPSADTGAGETKAGDKAPEVKPPEPLKYDAFKVPDQVKLADDRVKAFTDIVGPAQLKQETAQQLVDLHIGEMARVHDDALKAQRDHWTSLIDGWKTDIRKDPEIGGNRLETSLSIAKAVVEEYGGSKEQQADLWRHISETQGNGMGSYLGFVRLMHNIGRALNVFEDSIVPAASAPGGRSKEPGQRGWYKEGTERRASAG